jgi:hypothetical protein
MPTPEETMAFNNQDANQAAQNDQLDLARQMIENMMRVPHEALGMTIAPGSMRPEDRVQQLQLLRNFVSMKQPAAGYDPAMQLQSIDHEIARLTRPPRNPIVQSATDNQRGK